MADTPTTGARRAVEFRPGYAGAGTDRHVVVRGVDGALAAIDAAAGVLLAHAAEIIAAHAIAHPTGDVVPTPAGDGVRIHHAARDSLPSIAV